jgi:hypothetical protein
VFRRLIEKPAASNADEVSPRTGRRAREFVRSPECGIIQSLAMDPGTSPSRGSR